MKVAIRLTDEQQNAVDANGTVLIAAAAGSGKTAVLVERIIRLLSDTEKIINADNLLVVTFTNAAAAEMRCRIEKRINEECLKYPKNRHLQMQKLRIKSANICTIDSFCINLVKNNFQQLGLQSDIRVVTEEDTAAIRESAFSEVTEKKFAEYPEEFNLLTQSLDSGFGIRDFKEFVFSIYNKSKSMPFDKQWLADCKYKSTVPFEKSQHCEDLFLIAEKIADDCINTINQSLCEIEADEIINSACFDLFNSVKSQLSELSDCVYNRDWDGIVAVLNCFSFEAFGRKIQKSDSLTVKMLIAKHREIINKNIKKLSGYFYSDFDTVCKEADFCGRYTALLIDFVGEFSEIYEKKLVDDNSMTFNMAEHFALNLLCENKDGKNTYKPLAKEMSDIFAEVLVDEFQDVNSLQDTLFKALSNDGEKLFMVGDVKQSIYGFRNANPDIFLNKKNEFYDYDKKHFPAKIILDANFRSRSGICNFTNFLFEKIMSKQSADIEYDLSEQLRPLAQFPKTEEPDTDVLLIDVSNSDLKERETEAQHIASYIDGLTGKKILRAEDGTLREVTYDDFAVLLRSANTHGQTFAKVFSEYNIPFSFNCNEFAESSEVLTVISVLKAINSPSDSISMLAAAYSPVFNMSLDDIANIRAENRAKTLYGSLTLGAKNNDKKCIGFLNEFRELKRMIITMPLPEFLMYLYKKYALPEIFSAMQNGNVRKNNLLQLAELSRGFGDDNNFGVSSFLRYFDSMRESNGFKNIAGKSDGQGVKIMSIHASKGLQFPICIIAGCSKRFNEDDFKKAVAVSDKDGIAVSIKSNEKKLVINPTTKLAINYKLRKRMLQEEMRLLYVALTRAEERLVLSITSGNIIKKFCDRVSEIGSPDSVMVDGHLPAICVESASSYADWILSSLIFHPSSKELCNKAGLNFIPCDSSYIEPVNISFSELTEPETAVADNDVAEVNLENVERIKQRFSWQYPYSKYINNRAKIGVSELISRENERDFDFQKRPQVMYKNGLTSAEKGTLMHKVLELLDFKRAREDLTAELKRLTEWEYITEKECECIDVGGIGKFLNSKLCADIINSDFVKKEDKFIFKQKSFEDDDDGIIVQGCADLIFKNKNGLSVVDFKTTKFSDDEQFVKAYGEQLKVYADALSEVYGLPVTEKIIYSIFTSRAIYL